MNKVLLIYWSQNLGILKNIRSEYFKKNVIVHSIRIRHLSDLSINKFIGQRKNTHIFNLIYLIVIFSRLFIVTLKYKNIYLFGSNVITLLPFVHFFKKKKIICHYNELPQFLSKKKFFSIIEKKIFLQTKIVICSNKNRYDLISVIDKTKQYYILDNILEYSSYTKIIPEKANRLINIPPLKLLYIGLISDNRMINEIIDVVGNNKNIVLDIAGSVVHNKKKIFYNLVKKYDNVVFHGSISKKYVLKLIRNCNFGLALYNLEDLNNRFCAPLKIHEYFYKFKPVISLKNPPLLNIGKKYKIIYFIDEVKELAEKKVFNDLVNFELDTNDFINFHMESLNKFRKNIKGIVDLCT